MFHPSAVQDLALKLNLPPVDRQFVSGSAGRHEVMLYLAQIAAPNLGFTQHGQFAGVPLAAGGQQHQVLLGRTYLRNFIMFYDGVRGQVTLAR